ncbi:NUDIX domain-containing protein [Pseudoflavonifractor sp. 524-17]|uniref:NUDIX hydrolase n=1 Tax=Pseudoflavonifractor sp. 524-17 TaxID=2304577 RepID=UPI00137A2A25|nr:NUDIX hydrolase [Pseudoflavonifractor sp. 524-17]NCE63465.1 NUDIX domain-containing protein [Pseudoflavonifractor sp. 524-17]
MYLDEITAYRPQDQQEAADREMMLEYIRQFPDTILTRENRIAHMTASGFVVNADASRVLMAHHNIFKVWAWTGGHADGEGDLLSVALREAQEETGIRHISPLSEKAASLEILPVWGHVKRGEYVPAHQHLNVTYLLLADDADPLAPRPGENTKVGWLPADTLLNCTNEWQMDYVYTKLLRRARRLL